MPACGISNNEGQGSGVPGTGINCEKYFKKKCKVQNLNAFFLDLKMDDAQIL